MSDGKFLGPEAQAQFERARRRAFWNRVVDFLRGRRQQQLLSFDEVKDKLRIGCQSYVGTMPVEVEKIAGSVGRYRDFDRAFLPLQTHTSSRWKEIAEAGRRGRFLPPVKLYKVGDVYFVRDGHHRVSVAREQGVKYIDAEVIECQSRVPITPDVTQEELNLKAEYAEFLEATDLDELRLRRAQTSASSDFGELSRAVEPSRRPEQEIEFTISGAYKILLEHIAVHRYFLGLERGEAIPWQEAVQSWYDNLYRPIVQIIRQQGILTEFPGRREADLYLWIIEHHYYLREEGEVGLAEAAGDFAEGYSQRPVRRALRGVWHFLKEVLGETPLITDIETEAPRPGPPGGEESAR